MMRESPSTTVIRICSLTLFLCAGMVWGAEKKESKPALKSWTSDNPPNVLRDTRWRKAKNGEYYFYSSPETKLQAFNVSRDGTPSVWTEEDRIVFFDVVKKRLKKRIAFFDESIIYDEKALVAVIPNVSHSYFVVHLYEVVGGVQATKWFLVDSKGVLLWSVRDGAHRPYAKIMVRGVLKDEHILSVKPSAKGFSVVRVSDEYDCPGRLELWDKKGRLHKRMPGIFYDVEWSEDGDYLEVQWSPDVNSQRKRALFNSAGQQVVD